jgi:hypothetical protein
VLSHILAHVALRPELKTVFDALFMCGGAEMALHAANEYGLAGRAVRFADVQRAAHAHGAIALGVRAGGRLALNPERGQEWTFAGDDQIVVLAGGEGETLDKR